MRAGTDGHAVLRPDRVFLHETLKLARARGAQGPSVPRRR